MTTGSSDRLLSAASQLHPSSTSLRITTCRLILDIQYGRGHFVLGSVTDFMTKSSAQRPTSSRNSSQSLKIFVATIILMSAVGCKHRETAQAAAPQPSATPASPSTSAATMTTPSAAPAPAAASAPTAFQPTVPNISKPTSPAPSGMLWIPGGEFSMGAADSPSDGKVGMQATEDSRPVHRVYVDGFYMDKTDVTN